jgi:predicted nucleic acid-binding protein
MRPVFLDTSGLVAMVNGGDALHARARRLAAELHRAGAAAVTTEWVLAEFLSMTSKRRLRRGGVKVHPAGTRSFDAGFDLYKSMGDKEWSLIDCASMVVCRVERVSGVFTDDHHFEQAGLRVLLR